MHIEMLSGKCGQCCWGHDVSTIFPLIWQLCDMHLTLHQMRHYHCWLWRRDMATFSVLLVICAVNQLVTGNIFSQRGSDLVILNFEFFFVVRINKKWRHSIHVVYFELLHSKGVLFLKTGTVCCVTTLCISDGGICQLFHRHHVHDFYWLHWWGITLNGTHRRQ